MSETPESVLANSADRTSKILHQPENHEQKLIHSNLRAGLEIPIAGIGGLRKSFDMILDYRKKQRETRVLSLNRELKLELARETLSAMLDEFLMSTMAIEGKRAEHGLEGIKAIAAQDTIPRPNNGNILSRAVDKIKR